MHALVLNIFYGRCLEKLFEAELQFELIDSKLSGQSFNRCLAKEVVIQVFLYIVENIFIPSFEVPFVEEVMSREERMKMNEFIRSKGSVCQTISKLFISKS